MASWGNEQNTPFQQDMESPSGFHLVVTKNSNSDDTITANNTGTGNALKVNGRADFNNSIVTIHNSTSDVILDVSGGRAEVEFNQGGTTPALHVANSTGKALAVSGYASITDDSAEKTLELVNTNLDNHALWVAGKGRFTINTVADQDPLTVVNDNSLSPGGLKCHCPLKLKTKMKFYDTNTASTIDSANTKNLLLNSIASEGADIELGRSSGSNTIVHGMLQADGLVDINNTVDMDVNTSGVGLDVNNSNQTGTAIAIKATGPVALDAHGHIVVASGQRVVLDGGTGDNFLTYSSANSRIEFYVGGSLHFYIDDHGGHSV